MLLGRVLLSPIGRTFLKTAGLLSGFSVSEVSVRWPLSIFISHKVSALKPSAHRSPLKVMK